jgi:demethoxyubiquinone hydroxylase (CLK1/Coq7/Cat5 family)
MSEIKTLTEKIDKLSDLVEKVAVVIVRQDAHESAIDEFKSETKELRTILSKLEVDIAVTKESAENHERQSNKISDSISGAIKWGAGIAASLIVAGVCGAVTLFIKLS